jgi:plastocyanin
MRTTPSRLAALALAMAATTALAACGGDDDDDDDGPTAPTAPSAVSVEAGAAANTFTPPQITVARAGTVTWTFGTRTHNVTFATATGAPANVPNSSNAQVARTFNTAGTFAYECTLHTGMTGSVVVQ